MKRRRRWKIAGINFDFRHMDHLLHLAHEAPNAEIVGIWHHDAREMQDVIHNLRVPADRVFTDWRACLERTRPDVVILCPASGVHADWVERVAPYGAHLLVEKPFAGNLQQADRMIAAVRRARRRLAINWPLAWYP
ncbi:MAG TPA: Gfo/Idh/MocA family oxidoreductase, partial [Opitutaceae bacterium]|nr:Gfo/Idh/MocA family oxidoreductase [Opitutaceae bacterium]